MIKDNLPFISIIVPERNEEKHIEKCLEGIFNQTYPKDKMEVLVMDGMSKDKTREIAARFSVRILDNPKGHRPTAFNIGMKNAKGEFVLRIDARTIIPADYVQKCVETALATGADNVGGVQRPLMKGSAVQRAIGLAATHRFGVGDAQFRLGTKSGPAESVYLGCFKKAIFEKVGLLDELAPVISEDSDINYRIRKSGGIVYLNKDIAAYYIPRDNLKDLWKLYFRYGGARAGFSLKHKTLRWRQLVPPLFFVSLLALAGLSFYNRLFLFPFAVLWELYIFCDISVSFIISLRQKNIILFPGLFVVFPCMHFSWAAGFITRLFQRPKPGTYWGY